tara:strand:- start:128 stop:1252 length:1125 start_codon:yes stop_codon:yes gene_type:complete
MSYYELKDNDVFINTIEANPSYKFYIQSGSVYINDQQAISGTYSDNILGIPEGHISLYEYNVNRSASDRIYPFITKGAQKQKFKTMTDTEFNTQFSYSGELITGSYNMSSSVARMLITSSAEDNYRKLRALQSSCNHYAFWSKAFEFENYENTDVNMINVPSIFYGNSLKKGTVNLKYYISGTLAATATDSRKNGELLWNNDVVGTVMYNEGIILLTSSAEIDPSTLDYETSTSSSWIRYGYGMNDGNVIATSTLSASFALEFDTVSKLQNMTVLAKAPYGELNHSNNPTYLEYTGGEPTYSTSSYQFVETNREVKNVVPASQTDEAPPFQKETYISKICIYDKNKRLVGICKLATPIRKTEVNEYLFKMKIDL